MPSRLYSKLMEGLDDDQRLIFPLMFAQNPKIYDQIISVGYLVKGRDGGELTWCFEHTLERVLRTQDVEIVAKQLIVRLRLPWNETNFEWTVSRAELCEHMDDYEVLDTFIFIREKDTGKERYCQNADYEENRSRYEVLDVRYLVCWKPVPEKEAERTRSWLSI